MLRTTCLLIASSVPFLLAPGCRDSKRDENARAADASTGVQPSGEVLALVRLMESESGPKTTWDAYHRLQAKGAKALPSLLKLCDSNDPTLRRGAARGFAALKAPAARVLPALLRLTSDKDAEVRFAAIHALPKLQGELAPAKRRLRHLLRDPDQKVREAAVDVAIQRFSGPALGWLKRALTRKQAPVRTTAVRGLGLLGAASLPLLDRIISATRDPAEDVRYEACGALMRFGRPAAAAVPALERVLLQDGKAAVRLAAARALGAVASSEASAALTLGKALSDKDKRIRDVSAGALANMGQGAAPALPALRKALSDSSHRTRGPAASAVGVIGDRAAIPKLERLLTDSRFHVALSAAASLGLIGRTDPAAVKVLRRSLTHSSAHVREAAVEGVVKLGSKGSWALGTLRRMAGKDSSLSVRERASKALRALKP